MGNYEKGSEWRRWDLHLHTKSSYDYKYNGDDADDVLIKALRENEIKAVAITDHFLIDETRIKNLRELAPEIVFFPGVELRTDKGANNLHVILIFSNEVDVTNLSNKFNVIMKGKAKASDNNDKIYWDFNDIVEFAKSEDALISIHAGKKTSGVDQEIKSDTYPYKDAVKDEIASVVDFFDMGKKKDFEDYRKYVFPCIGEKPMIICSDNHDARKYAPSESLWIKADCTFEGLKQCVFQPSDRVYVGVIPPSLDRVNKNKRNTLSRISIKKIPTAMHKNMNWFDVEIPLNSNLVTVIGNKGSGKSAFSDIIGHLCKCHTMEQASFLSEKRFRNQKFKYANDYKADIEWADGHIESNNLGEVNTYSEIESAQYLPQAYIERVCNDIDDEFQQEINRVIFSYVNPVERGNATNLDELVENKTKDSKAQKKLLLNKLQHINEEIIKLEQKKTLDYRSKIIDGETKLQEDLQRHDTIKPIEVKRPDNKEENQEYQDKLFDINSRINAFEKDKKNTLYKISELNSLIDELNLLITEMEAISNEVSGLELKLNTFKRKFHIYDLESLIKCDFPVESYKSYLDKCRSSRNVQYNILQGDDNNEGLDTKIEKLKNDRIKHIENGNADEKKYQKYILDLKEWNEQREAIIGNKTTIDTLAYYQFERNYLENSLDKDYEELLNERKKVVSELYYLISSLISTYNDIYKPVQSEIKNILGGIKEKIEFKAEVQLTDNEFVEKVLSFIKKGFAGVFKGKLESREKMIQIVNGTMFDSFESISILLEQVLEVITEDLNLADKKVPDRLSFYNYIFSLDFIGVDFKLKVGGRELSELSPGERGIVLLIFYLALSQDYTPIVVDQPEDNLDNQSVYSNLVPCINAAKEKRQVIIVTHNPNIAVACDAEQIIYCEMDKDKYQISYISGSIENSNTRQHVVDVLEGTMPAFELRRKKYFKSIDSKKTQLDVN